jgi:hypothetical protein
VPARIAERVEDGFQTDHRLGGDTDSVGGTDFHAASFAQGKDAEQVIQIGVG